MGHSGGAACARRSARGARASFGQRRLKAGGVEDQQRLEVRERRLGSLVGVDVRRARARRGSRRWRSRTPTAEAGCGPGTTRTRAPRGGRGRRRPWRRTPRPRPRRARRRRAAARRRSPARGSPRRRPRWPTSCRHGPSMPSSPAYQSSDADALAQHVRVAEPRAGGDQRLREPGVVVGQHVLGPVPVRRRVGALQVGEPAGEGAQDDRASPPTTAGSARARPSAAKAIVRGQRCSASAGSISRSRIRLGSSSARDRLGRRRPRPAPRRRARDGRRRAARRASGGRRP